MNYCELKGNNNITTSHHIFCKGNNELKYQGVTEQIKSMILISFNN